MMAPEGLRERIVATRRRMVLLCGVLPALVVAAVGLYRPSVLAQLDNRLFDALVRSLPRAAASSRVAVVDVDERSIGIVGQWPWRRDVIARLIAGLRRSGAAVVAFDILFAEPDRFDVAAPLGTPGTDALLADEIRRGGVILGYAFSFDDQPRTSSIECLTHPLNSLAVAGNSGEAEPRLFRATGTTCSLPVLSRAADGSGFLNAMPDSDGVLRRMPLVIEHDGRYYPSLALAAVTAAGGSQPFAIGSVNVNSTSLTFEQWTVPLDGRGNLLLRYRGRSRTLPHVAAADVLNGTASAEALQDAIVFIGGTAPGVREFISTPYDRLFSGVEVHATVADNLLSRDFFSRPPDDCVARSTSRPRLDDPRRDRDAGCIVAGRPLVARAQRAVRVAAFPGRRTAGGIVRRHRGETAAGTSASRTGGGGKGGRTPADGSVAAVSHCYP
jgi:adenylate cyclase